MYINVKRMKHISEEQMEVSLWKAFPYSNYCAPNYNGYMTGTEHLKNGRTFIVFLLCCG